MKKFGIKVGLEVHVELKTESKMFCRCKNDSESQNPNMLNCPVCMALPGSLPVLNKRAVELAVKAALSLNCKINKISKFDRKSYFYPDLPKGYQISQYFLPIACDGYLEIKKRDKMKIVRINRLHLEEDTAKMVHAGDRTLIDYNRAGIPLMEVVTYPDIDDPAEAKIFLKKIRDLLVWIKVSRARMQLGELRCDTNISLVVNGKQYGEVIEIKNLNSFKSVENALNYEFERMKSLYTSNEKIHKETRGWDARNGKTILQRTKEYAHDYRYFPDPDLPEIVLTDGEILEIGASIPVLSDHLSDRMKNEYELNDDWILKFINDLDCFYYFEELFSEIMLWLKEEKVEYKRIDEIANKTASFLVLDVVPRMKSKHILLSDDRVSRENLAELLVMQISGKITNHMARNVLDKMIDEGGDPSDIFEKIQENHKTSLNNADKIMDEVIENNPDLVKSYKAGKLQLLSFFVGQVMKATGGVLDPKEIQKNLEDKLLN